MSQVQCHCPKCRTALRLAAAPGTMPAVRCRVCGTTFRVNVPPVASAPQPRPVARKETAERPVARRPAAPRREDDVPAPDRSKAVLLGAAVGIVLLLVAGVGLALFLASREQGRPVAQAPAPSPARPAAAPGAVVLPPPEDGAPWPSRPADDSPPASADPEASPIRPPLQLPERPGEPESPPPVPPPEPPADSPRTPAPEPPPLPPGERPVLVLDSGGHTALVKEVMFTPDGRQIVSVSFDKTIRLWDAATGEALRVLRLPVGPGEEGGLGAAALSPDGTRLAVGGNSFGGGKFGSLVHVIALPEGRVERVLKGHRNIITGLAFSADGRLLVSASADHTARVCDVQTGDTVAELTGPAERVTQPAFSPDGRLIAAGSFDHTVSVWRADGRGAPLVLRGHPDAVNCVAWSHDGALLASGGAGQDGSVRLWKPDGAPVAAHTLKVPEGITKVLRLAFTPDDRALLYAGVRGLGRAGLLDVATGQYRLEFKDQNNAAAAGALSPDGTLAATAGGDENAVIVWKVADGATVHRLQGGGRSVWGVGWSADGKALAWGGTNGDTFRGAPLEQTFRLDDLDLGGAPAADVGRCRLTGDGCTLEPLDFLRVAVKRAGQPTQVLQAPRNVLRLYSASLLPGGRVVLGASPDVFVMDLATGQVVRRLVGHAGVVTGIAPSPDGRYFVTGATDQTLRVWSPEREEPLLSIFVAGSEWIAWTPEGYYAASPYGERLMGWQINNGPDRMASYYPAVQFRASLYQPEVIRRVLAEGSVEKALAAVARERKQPVAGVTLSQVLPPTVVLTAPAAAGGRARVDRETVVVKAKAVSTGTHPVTALRLLVDGRPYQGDKGLRPVAAPRLGAVEASWEVALAPGKHVLAAQAQSAVSKGLSAPVEVTRTGADKEPPSLYVVAVGVSAYPGKLRLHYAASDAELIGAVFRDKGRGLFGKVEVRVVTDRDATRARILKELDWLASVMTPRDVAVVAFSGHGARDPAGNFYLVPIDASSADAARTLVAGEELKLRLANVPGKVVALLDACHSGQLAEGLRTSRPDNLVRDLVTDDYGVVVMCSSLGREYSLESSETKAGFFTRSVVDGLRGAADFNKDGVVYVHELDRYAALRVRELSGGQQHPVTGLPPTIRSFPLTRP